MTARAEARSAARTEAFQLGHLTWRALASRRHCRSLFVCVCFNSVTFSVYYPPFLLYFLLSNFVLIFRLYQHLAVAVGLVYLLVYISTLFFVLVISINFYPNVTTFPLSSVTFVHPTHPAEIFGNVFMPFYTVVIRGPPCNILQRSSQGNLSVGG